MMVDPDRRLPPLDTSMERRNFLQGFFGCFVAPFAAEEPEPPPTVVRGSDVVVHVNGTAADSVTEYSVDRHAVLWERRY